jgi:hypothetical protein
VRFDSRIVGIRRRAHVLILHELLPRSKCYNSGLR